MFGYWVNVGREEDSHKVEMSLVVRRFYGMDLTRPNCYVFICRQRDGAVIMLEGEKQAGEFGMDVGARVKETEKGT